MRTDSPGLVLCKDVPAGVLERDGAGFSFRYLRSYLADPAAPDVAITLPKRAEPYFSSYLFPFFAGLLTEGEQRELQCRLYHIDPADGFTRLLTFGRYDTIGAVNVVPLSEHPEVAADA